GLWTQFANLPTEYLENSSPLRVERYAVAPDSGGAGRHRGGNGMEVIYRLLEPGWIAIHDDRWLTHPWGVLGGRAGARGRKVLEKTDGHQTVLPSKTDDVSVASGDRLHYVTWGGGGWGDPLDRDPELVARDV